MSDRSERVIERVTVILATIKWDFVWQRHQALAVAAADRSAVVFVESQPRRATQLLAFLVRLLGALWQLPVHKAMATPSAPSRPVNPRPDGVRLVGASALALTWPALWARLLARSITRAHPGSPVDVVLYAPTPAYVRLARLLEKTGGTVVYDAVVDWDTVPAGWWPPHRARAREVAMSAGWRVTSDSASLAGVLATAMDRPVEVVLPAADPAFAAYPWDTGKRSGTIGWFGVVRDETDVDLLAACARSGLPVETIGPVETHDLRTTLESAGVLVRDAMGPDELPAAMAHWDAVLCAYQGPRATTITPAKIFNALTGFTVFTRGLRLPEQLAAAVHDLPADDDAAVAVIRESLATPHALSALPGQRSQSWADRLDQLLDSPGAGAEFLDRAEFPVPSAPAHLLPSEGVRSLGAVVAEQGRANGANAVRLAMALLVIAYHGFMLGGWAEMPRLGFLGDIGVDVFFVVSGFFIAMSWERSSGLGRFLWHRALRILPAFWTCLVLTAGLAALVAVTTGAAGPGFWSSPHNPLAYVTDNALLKMQYFDISGGPVDVPHQAEWNRSLWTLFWEAKAYLGLAVIGLVARAWKPAWRLLPLGALLAALVYMGGEQVTGVEQSNLVRFVGVFCAGTVLWTWREKVPYDGRIAVACALVVPLTWFGFQTGYRSIGLVPMAYLTLWVIYRRPAPALFKHDISYGVYIYAFPVGQLLAILGVASLGYPAFVLATVAVTLPVAAASWFLVEKPALAHKDLALPRLRFALPAALSTGGKP